MNRQRPLIAFAAIFFFLGSTEARLGETETQIQTRYGNPIALLPTRAGDPGLTKCYSSAGFIISVTYVKGGSVREIFTKTNKSKLTEAEIQSTLKANVASSPWKAEELVSTNAPIVGIEKWRTTDRSQRVAFYDSQTRALFITTQRFIDLNNATKRQALARSSSTGLGGLGGHPVRNYNPMDRGSVMNALRAQPQPSASPGKN